MHCWPCIQSPFHAASTGVLRKHKFTALVKILQMASFFTSHESKSLLQVWPCPPLQVPPWHPAPATPASVLCTQRAQNYRDAFKSTVPLPRKPFPGSSLYWLLLISQDRGIALVSPRMLPRIRPSSYTEPSYSVLFMAFILKCSYFTCLFTCFLSVCHATK